MMPLVSNTQLFVPTQPTLVATALPGTNAVRAPFFAVAPSVSNASITPDNKGTGIYTSPGPATTPSSVAPPLLSTPIPASFSTSMASLSASAMYATQSLAQDTGSAKTIFSTYDQLIEASLVKYKPSNASLPQPEVGGMFAKMLKEQRAGNENNLAAQLIKNTVKESASPPPLAAASAAPPAARTSSAKEPARSMALVRSEIAQAAQAYRATSARNTVELTQDRVDAING